MRIRMQHRHRSQTRGLGCSIGTVPKRVSLSHLFDRKSIWKLRLQRRPLLKQFWWWTFHLRGVGKQTISNKKSNRETKNTLTVPKYVFIVLFGQMMKSFCSNFCFFGHSTCHRHYQSLLTLLVLLVSVSNSKQHRLGTKTKISASFFLFWSGRTHKTKIGRGGKKKS